jgi:hypothetical protein
VGEFITGTKFVGIDLALLWKRYKAGLNAFHMEQKYTDKICVNKIKEDSPE